MNQKVLVDMDGVLADVYSQFINFEYKDSGIKLDISTMYGKREEDVFPSFDHHIRTLNFFRTAPLVADSVEGLRYLNDKYNVMIVSSATEFPDSLIEKYQWLTEFFPFIMWEQMIFCGRKDSIQGDIMIDDHIKNLKPFNGIKILFTQPHNACIKNKEFQRVYNWKEIMSIL